MTKFLIVGDLHGQIPKIREKKFDAIIAPGDFCSDELKKYIDFIEKSVRVPVTFISTGPDRIQTIKK